MINLHYSIYNSIHAIIIVVDIKCELQSFQHWRLAFVRREGNEVAHCLSRVATKHLTDQSWFSKIPRMCGQCTKDGAYVR
jgi:hypothetical protein